jgi:hypothetical protein
MAPSDIARTRYGGAMPRERSSSRLNAAIASTRVGLRSPFSAPLPGRSSVITDAFGNAAAKSLAKVPQ